MLPGKREAPDGVGSSASPTDARSGASWLYSTLSVKARASPASVAGRSRRQMAPMASPGLRATHDEL